MLLWARALIRQAAPNRPRLTPPRAPRAAPAARPAWRSVRPPRRVAAEGHDDGAFAQLGDVNGSGGRHRRLLGFGRPARSRARLPKRRTRRPETDTAENDQARPATTRSNPGSAPLPLKSPS